MASGHANTGGSGRDTKHTWRERRYPASSKVTAVGLTGDGLTARGCIGQMDRWRLELVSEGGAVAAAGLYRSRAGQGGWLRTQEPPPVGWLAPLAKSMELAVSEGRGWGGEGGSLSVHTVYVLTGLEGGDSSPWFSRTTSRYSDGVSSRKGTQHIWQHLASLGGSGFLSDMGGKSESATYDEQNPEGQSPTRQEPRSVALRAQLPSGSMHKKLSGTAQHTPLGPGLFCFLGFPLSVSLSLTTSWARLLDKR